MQQAQGIGDVGRRITYRNPCTESRQQGQRLAPAYLLIVAAERGRGAQLPQRQVLCVRKINRNA